jgi:hypothetical protein
MYAGSNHKLVSKKIALSYIRRGIVFSLFAPIGFTVSIGIAFFNATTAIVFWVMIFLVHFMFQRRLKPQGL